MLVLVLMLMLLMYAVLIECTSFEAQRRPWSKLGKRVHVDREERKLRGRKEAGQ